jgi:hypothetical protein
MSKTRETSLWQWLKKAAPEFAEDLCLDRVENAAMSGMADVNGCLRGQEFWIELKTSARPSSPDTRIKPRFQPGQPEWLRKRSRAGSKAYVLLQVGQGGQARRYLLDGVWAKRLAAHGFTEAELVEQSLVPPVAFAAEVVSTAANPFHSGR